MTEDQLVRSTITVIGLMVIGEVSRRAGPHTTWLPRLRGLLRRLARGCRCAAEQWRNARSAQKALTK